MRSVDDLIARAASRDRDAIFGLLKVQGAEQERLFEAARALRDRIFGPTAVVRGVVEITSACVKSCLYCPMRQEVGDKRYFRRRDEILASASAIRDSGIGVAFFQGGEIGSTTALMLEVIPEVRALFDDSVEILLSLGDKPLGDLQALKAAGADSYILKHETADPELHLAMRQSTLADRLDVANNLLDLNYRLGLGTIVGLPRQTEESLVDDILLPGELGAHMTSASPFIPAAKTPLASADPGDVDLTLNVIALMRLANPRALIPTVSALERRHPGGQLRGFLAGANVITVNFTPEADQSRYPIYGHDRFIVGREHAFKTLADAGLSPRLGTDAFALWNGS